MSGCGEAVSCFKKKGRRKSMRSTYVSVYNSGKLTPKKDAKDHLEKTTLSGGKGDEIKGFKRAARGG